MQHEAPLPCRRIWHLIGDGDDEGQLISAPVRSFAEPRNHSADENNELSKGSRVWPFLSLSKCP